VNTASRMETHALPGTIQVTERTRDLLAGRFELERRDAVEVKGKGPMTTYLPLGPAGPYARAFRAPRARERRKVASRRFAITLDLG